MEPQSSRTNISRWVEMYDSKRLTNPSRSRGFSLVELLVSLVFISILMAGMFSVFASSTSSFVSQSEGMAVQRKARWGLNLLQDEILEAGHLVFKRVVGDIDPTSATGQPPLLIRTTTEYTLPSATSSPDEIQIVMDLPLGVQGTLTATHNVGDNTLKVSVPYGGAAIEAGDLVFLQDSNWEILQVKTTPTPGGATSFDIVIEGDQSALVDKYGNQVNSVIHALIQKMHLKHCPFTVFRPLQVIRYAILPRALDPSSNATVPCLVRQTRSLTGNASVFWAPAPTTPVAGEQVLLENVTGLYINLSLDGGKTWLRPAAGAIAGVPPWKSQSWSDIRSLLNTALGSSTSPLTKQAQGGLNVQDPFWMNYAPVLIRIDLETRSAIQRTEFNTASTATAPAAAFRTRRETLMLSPKNFALGRP